jgi:hypothetical protein
MASPSENSKQRKSMKAQMVDNIELAMNLIRCGFQPEEIGECIDEQRGLVWAFVMLEGDEDGIEWSEEDDDGA